MASSSFCSCQRTHAFRALRNMCAWAVTMYPSLVRDVSTGSAIGCRCTGWCASCAYCSGLFGRRVGGCRFRLQQECTSDVRTFKLRLVRVAAEVMELWRRSGDGLALGTDAPLAIERRPHVPVCPSVGGNLGELSAGDLPQQDFRGVRGCTSTSRAFYIQVAVPMRLPDAGRLMGSNLLEDGFRTVTFFLKVSPQ